MEWWFHRQHQRRRYIHTRSCRRVTSALNFKFFFILYLYLHFTNFTFTSNMYVQCVRWLFPLPTLHIPLHTPCLSNQHQHSQHVGLHWCGVPPSVWYSHGTYECSFAGSVPSERHHFDTASCIETPLILNELKSPPCASQWVWHE